MIIEEADYLEHFGVKGMRWGVRRRPSFPINERASPKQEKSGMSRNKKIAIAVGVGVGAIAVGAVIANKKSGGKAIVSASELRSKLKVNEGAVNDILRKSGKVKASDIRPPKAAKKAIAEMSPETKKFISEFSARQNLLNKAANADLKDLYEKGQVPLPLREYLSAWEIEL